MKNLTTLGEKVRSLRQKLKMTQQELAGDDFTKSFISQIEKNQTKPSLKSLQIIATRLNKPISYFIDESYAEPAPQTKEVYRQLILGRRLCKEKQYSLAIDCLNRALSGAAGNPALRGAILLDLARCYDENGNLLKAQEVYQEALTQFEAAEEPERIAWTLNALSTVYQRRRQVSEAISLLRRALAEIEKAAGDESDSLRLRILSNLGTFLASQGSFGEALPYLQEALDYGHSQENYFKYGDICQTLSYIYGKSGQLDDAIAYAQKARKFFDAVDNPVGTGRSANNLGSLYRMAGRFKEAETALQESVAFGEKTGDPVLLSSAYEELALLAKSNNEPRKAKEFLLQALSFEKAPQRAARLHATYAKWEKEDGSLQSAEEHLEKAERVCISGKVTGRVLAEIYAERGEVGRLLGKNEEAQAYVQKSLELYRSGSENA